MHLVQMLNFELRVFSCFTKLFFVAPNNPNYKPGEGKRWLEHICHEGDCRRDQAELWFC